MPNQPEHLTPHIPTVVGDADCRDCAGQWPIPRARSTPRGELVIEYVHRCGRRPAPGDDSPIPFSANTTGEA